ncbi:hypothetical protein ACFOZ5_04210 [Marinobacter lacisalsi]|uniref:Secreted protein n=1 Tax=Marinobacter lacisalsi TaxID=475979 RepID=A0ABV8QFB0_9GAMM
MMRRWLIALTTLVLLGTAPVVMADRDHHERGREWHQEGERSDGRMRMRVRDSHEYHRRHHHRDNGWHHGHHKKRRWHHDNDRRDRRHRQGYRDHHRYDRDRGGIVIGIGDDRQGVVIWNR